MVAAANLIGQRFGKLVVLERAGSTARGQALWRLKCDCGGETTATTGVLRQGRHRSCSCGLSQPKHGMHSTRLYSVWEGMRHRCLRSSHPRFHRYGGRGITICVDWSDFATFASWAIAHGYADHLQIDRIDNGGNYEPSNCRFVTAAENMANRG